MEPALASMISRVWGLRWAGGGRRDKDCYERLCDVSIEVM